MSLEELADWLKHLLKKHIYKKDSKEIIAQVLPIHEFEHVRATKCSKERSLPHLRASILA